MIFTIAFKDLKVVFRDKKALAIMLIMPLLIIWILGTALSATFNKDVALERFTVGVVNQDNGPISDIFINKVLKTEMGKIFDIVALTENDANSILKNEKDKTKVILFIPKEFSNEIQRISSDKQINTAIKIKYNEQYKIEGTILQSVTSGFIQTVSSFYITASDIEETFKNHNIELLNSVPSSMRQLAIINGIQERISKSGINFTVDTKEANKNVSAIQYYSITMLAMFLLFGGNMGSKLFLEEKESYTLNRILSTQCSKFSLIVGKFIGLFAVCFIQAMLLILFTRFVYNVNWGNSVPTLLLITASGALMSAAFGICIASLSKTVHSADGMGSVIIQVFTIIGGGMIPLYILPPIVKILSNIVPNMWLTKAYIDLAMGVNTGEILFSCGVLGLMSVCYIGVGLSRLKI